MSPLINMRSRPVSIQSKRNPAKRIRSLKYAALFTILLSFVFLAKRSPLFRRRHPSYRAPPLRAIHTIEPYDLAYLLDVPSFVDKAWRAVPHEVESRAARMARAYPDSLLAIYRAIPSSCSRKPFPPHLRHALRIFRESKKSPVSRDEDLVKRNDTLVLLIQSNGNHQTSLPAKFVQEALHRSRSFSNVLVMAYLGDTGTPENARLDTEFIVGTLKSERINVRVHKSTGEDEDIYLMHIAANLFVHRGAFSALGALVCDGTVFYTSEMEDYMKQNQYKWMLRNGQPAVDIPDTVPLTMWRAMGPVSPTCCRFEGFGHGDGEKILCANSKTFSGNACWILSLGCQGKWSFEKEIVKRTNCKIHTFDCTGTWPIPEELQGRVTLHKTCLGKDDDPREDYVGWNRIIAMGSTRGAKKMPALVKMDIEGYEFPVLQALLSKGDESMLPEQLAIEMHAYKATPKFMGELFTNFTRRGYSMTHRADNPWCAHCTEITVSRKSDLPESYAVDV